MLAETSGWHSSLADAATWTNGTILFTAGNGAIIRVPDTGGTATPLHTLPWKGGENSFAWPRFLPDGRRFLVSKAGDPALFVASLDTDDMQRVAEDCSRAAYVARHLLFFRGSAVFARPFDAARLVFTGGEAGRCTCELLLSVR